MRHYSFALSRPGLKAGCYVPLRLRVVDTVTMLSGVPMLIAAIGISMWSLGWAQQLGLGIIWRKHWALYGYMLLILFASAWILYFWCIGLLRLIFRCLGMMTEEESQYYPLEASKKRFDPWPGCWQREEKEGTRGE
jgi:hypothetical protein